MKFILPFLLFTLFILEVSPKSQTSFRGEHLFVWNIGQGQMITYLTPTHCHHLDMGGEKFPQKKLFSLCKNKKNDVRYTHFDWDHINFSKKARRIFPSLCRVSLSPLPSLTKRKSFIIKSLPICPYTNHPDIQYLNVIEKFPQQVKTSNDSSFIFIVKNKILIPGDSSANMEFYWAPLIQNPIQVLITGHHGSKSSTSSFLIDHLPQLRLAISSARFKRYKHPHPLVQHRLNQKGVLLIRTEHKGHIHIPLNTKDSFKYFVF